MKFLHAADIHLDSPLAGLRNRTDLPAAVTAHVTRRAFSAMVDLARAEDVAFIIIAGDLYDGDWRDFSTGLFFAEEMRRLDRPCFLLRGNHDARSLITRNLKPPPNVREFSASECDTFQLPELGVALHGRSFPARAVPEDLSAGYNPPLPGLLNIGVLHTSADDPGEHETYAPCSPAALALKGYDYWALGHIHQRRVLSERPWIVFPGNLQGRHPKETGAKGCSLVTVEDRRIAAVEHRSLDQLRWAALAADITGLDDAALAGRLADLVGSAIAEAAGRPVLARLTITGASDLHPTLSGQEDRLAAECRNAAIEAGGQIWIESVRLRSGPVSLSGADTLAPLRAAFGDALEDPAIVQSLLADFTSMGQKLPQPARIGLDLPADQAGLRRMLDEAWEIAAQAIDAPVQ